ncbi:MAG: hypothetical protein B6D59_02525 [Campylobacteraceae bacterium 4484_4]|nr:MAG: hypothetical protein B6D59_02525 [Campylobacteraceae bacterium 4484_4]
MKETKTAIITVRYAFDAEKFRKNLLAIAKEFPIYVFDNSKEPIDTSGIANLHYLHEGENRGLMYGINRCVEAALQEGKEVAVYFDQDSHTDPALIRSLNESFETVRKSDPKLFALGPLPVRKDQTPYDIHPVSEPQPGLFLVEELITSGSVFSLRAIEEVGFYDEGLFVDTGDFEICWRAGERGYHCYIDTRIRMVHEIGVENLRVLGKTMPISSPLRNYYQTRNITALLLRRPLYRKYQIHFLRRLVNITLNLLFVPPRLKRARYNLLGFYHGVIQKMGRLDV